MKKNLILFSPDGGEGGGGEGDGEGHHASGEGGEGNLDGQNAGEGSGEGEGGEGGGKPAPAIPVPSGVHAAGKTQARPQAKHGKRGELVRGRQAIWSAGACSRLGTLTSCKDS